MIQQEQSEIYRNKKYVRVPHLVGYGDDSGWAKYWSASCASGCATSCTAPKFELTLERTSDWSGSLPLVVDADSPTPMFLTDLWLEEQFQRHRWFTTLDSAKLPQSSELNANVKDIWENGETLRHWLCKVEAAGSEKTPLSLESCARTNLSFVALQ